ncbi:MAG: aminotransferase class IV [Spirochaetota bacterium]
MRRIAAQGGRRIEPVPYDATSLSDAARYERPGGVYAAFGTWHDRAVIRLSDHFDRFEDSARRLGFEIGLDRALVRAELCEMLESSGMEGARIRLSAHPEDFGPSVDRRATMRQGEGARTLIAAIEPYAGPPRSQRERGVTCATAPHAARDNPRAKQTSWLAERARLAGAGGTGDGEPTTEEPYEWILLSESGLMLEGSRTNFYAITDAGQAGASNPGAGVELRTAGDGILHGISRSIVLDVAEDVVPLRLEAPRIRDLRTFREAFITSASRGIVPVVRIDEVVIGDGAPGVTTRELIRRYDRRATELEEPLC